MAKNTIGTKYGIIAGVGVILYFLLFYFIDKYMMLGLMVSWTSLLIIIAATYMAAYQHRAANGGVIEFKEALKTGFVVIVLSNLIYYIFFFILIKTDPELVTISKEKSIELYKMIFPKEEWNSVEKSFENFRIGLPEILKYFSKSTIGGFFIALLSAALLKRSATRTNYE